jgi:hypothetical protein
MYSRYVLNHYTCYKFAKQKSTFRCDVGDREHLNGLILCKVYVHTAIKTQMAREVSDPQNNALVHTREPRRLHYFLVGSMFQGIHWQQTCHLPRRSRGSVRSRHRITFPGICSVHTTMNKKIFGRNLRSQNPVKMILSMGVSQTRRRIRSSTDLYTPQPTLLEPTLCTRAGSDPSVTINLHNTSSGIDLELGS